MRRIAALSLVVVSVISGFANDANIKKLKETARELDEIVSQTNVVYQEVIRPGFPTVKHKLPPIPLERVAFAASTRLDLPKERISQLIQGDKTKLSEIVLARLIEQTGGKAWQELIAKKDPAALYRQIQEQQLLERAQKTLDDLFTEMSFASLDQMNKDAAIGAPPARNEGKDQQQPGEKHE